MDSLITKKNEIRQVKICLSICIIVLISPLMVCDLYYGFSGEECLDEYPSQIHLNLKKYLLVNGFISLFTLVYMIIMIHRLSFNEDDNSVMMVINICASYMIGILLTVWNIMGAIIFWNFIFPEHSCNEELSNYLFASIIIKLVLSWGSLTSSNSSD
jgi:hypothetical protein